MFERRRATQDELAQGQREMEDAQKRMERELEQSGELQIGDGGEPESFESPKMVREDQLGREEKLAGTPKVFQPPVPEQGTAKASQVPATEKATEDVSAKPVVQRSFRCLCNKLVSSRQAHRGHLFQQRWKS